jgi:Sulfotransferase family
MIICHRHRFIFLKTTKTASTSIEIALSRFCGADDVITRIFREDEGLRRELGYPGAQNTHVPARLQRRDERLRAWWRGKPQRFPNHATAAWIRRHVDAEVWRGYFKFCFERNPYDKAVSRYYWSTRDEAEPPALADFLASADPRLISNWHIYATSERIAVDFVGRYERLDEDLGQALRRIGLPVGPPLPRAKSRFRRDARPYREILDARARARIERICARELAAFDYRWEDG